MFDLPFVAADVPGHLSYILIAISYWLTNILWLRITAIAGLFLEIIYFRLSGGAMHAGIGWDLVFIAINVYQVYRLVEEQRSLTRVQDAHLLRQGVFAGFSNLQLARLVTAGRWESFETGTVITTEGTEVNRLVLLCDGRASVEVGGTQVTQLHAGAFIGEMAFVTGRPASATVTAAAPIRAFVFNVQHLRRLVDSDELVAAAMHRVLGRDLAAKLKSRNDEMGAAVQP